MSMHDLWTVVINEREAARAQRLELEAQRDAMSAELDEVYRAGAEAMVRLRADCDAHAARAEELARKVTALEIRKQELLETIVRMTRELPYPDEIKNWTAQRAKLLTEIGTLRARVAELEFQPMPNCDNCNRPLATQMDYDTIPDDEGEHLCWRAWSSGACSRSPEDWRARALAAEVGCARRDLVIDALTARVAEVMARLSTSARSGE